jgi:membrane protein implicated in regulation of membrane protease activity
MLSPLQMHVLLALAALLCFTCMAAAWGLLGDKNRGSPPPDRSKPRIDEKNVGQACKVIQTAPLLVEIEKNCFSAYCSDTVVVGDSLIIIQIHGDAVAVRHMSTQAGD